ncbi:hypothetical protein BHE74_00047126 [Ensete ventricosum]|nr:hypothetical protein GW17_00038415 [Ensete ventricosum]RWW46923.1 hypothetical protein BHE74_00047126 [Ensete ventricosum]RZS21009.1 hypothetical protein BHM03_00053597 [Ensete ventricosum]
MLESTLVLGGVAAAQSLWQCFRGSCLSLIGDLVWLASVGGASLFASASFHSSVGSSVVNACTKVVVGGRGATPTRPL